MVRFLCQLTSGEFICKSCPKLSPPSPRLGTSCPLAGVGTKQGTHLADGEFSLQYVGFGFLESKWQMSKMHDCQVLLEKEYVIDLGFSLTQIGTFYCSKYLKELQLGSQRVAVRFLVS